MADYNSMKVPELKKLLSERGLTQAGNKADLIARLQDNDKETTKTDEAPPAPSKDVEPEDEIDYEDDDFPTPAVASNPATTAPDATTTVAPATTDTKAATTETKTSEAPAPTTSDDAKAAPATTTEATPAEADADKKKDAATTTEAEPEKPAEPLFSQHLPPTDAKTEAEKRAARAARFGAVAPASADGEKKETDEFARKADRAARFGLPVDQVSALDSALPDRPHKRGRDNKEDGANTNDNTRGNKRRSTGAAQQGGAGGGAGGRRDNRPQHPRRNDRRRQGGGGGGGNNPNINGQKRTGGGGAPPAKSIDAAEKARMEARAKRFGA